METRLLRRIFRTEFFGPYFKLCYLFKKNQGQVEFLEMHQSIISGGDNQPLLHYSYHKFDYV